MKVRWRSIFTKAHEVKIPTAVKVIVSCAVMHNICLTEGDIIEAERIQRHRQPILRVPRNAIAGENFRRRILRSFLQHRNRN